jgi:hypothetical protein
MFSGTCAIQNQPHLPTSEKTREQLMQMAASCYRASLDLFPST